MEKILRFLKQVLLIASFLVLASCGGGGGGGSTAASTATLQAGANEVLISGFAAKGTVLNATVRATQIVDGQLSGVQKDTVLGPNGNFAVAMPKGLVHLEVIPQANSTTQDEATGVAVALPLDFKFRAAADLTDSTAATVSLNITPFSEIGVALAGRSGGLMTANINKANSGIANILGFDHLGTKPIQSNNTAELATATADEKKLSVANAAVSDMAATDASGCGVKATYGQTIDCTIFKLGDQFQMNTAGSTPRVVLTDKGSQSFVVSLAKVAANGATALKDITVDIVQDGVAFTQRQQVKPDYQARIQGDDYKIDTATKFFPLAIISDLVYLPQWVNGSSPGATLDMRSRPTSGSYNTSGNLTVLNWTDSGINSQEATDADLQWNAFYNSGMVIFAYRGTETWADWENNFESMVCSLKSNNQYNTALRQFQVVMQNKKVVYKADGITKKFIVVTGHSLGGGIASYIAKKETAVDLAVGFNPAPHCNLASIIALQSPVFISDAEKKIWNLRIAGDLLWNVTGISNFLPFLGLHFPGLQITWYPSPYPLAGANVVDNHLMKTVLFALDAAKDLCPTTSSCVAQNSTQSIQTPVGSNLPLAVTGIQSSYSTGVAPYRPQISLSGTNLSAINQISWSCTQPNGAACPGSPYVWTPSNWAGKVDIFNDTSIKVYPGLLALGDATGTYNWAATFSALNSTPVSIPFTVTYQPQLATGVAVESLISTGFTLGTTTISTSASPTVASLIVTGNNLGTVGRIEWRWSGAATGSATWQKSDPAWNSKVALTADGKLILSPTVVEANPAWSGTVIWTGTLLDMAGSSQNVTFSVIYQPPLSFTSPSLGSITANTAGYQPTLTASGNVTRIDFSWSGASIGSATWIKNDTNWLSKVTTNPDGTITFRPVVTQVSDLAGTTNWTVTLRDGSGATQTQSFTVNYQPTSAPATPAISSLSLASVPADSTARTLTVYGSNFAAGNVVQYRWLNPVGSSTATASVSSASQLSASFNPGSVADTIYVKVCQSAGSAACSGELAISVTALAPATPAISSLSLASVPADSTARTLTVYGSNFASGNVVKYRWLNPAGSSSATASVSSASQLSASFNPGNVADTIYVKVCQSSTSTACSGELAISVTALAPATPGISSLSLASVPADSTARTLTVYGSNFASGNVVKYRWLNPAGSSSATASVSSASQLSASFNPGNVADTIYVKVCQSSTSAACSGELAISVTALVPTLTVNGVPSSYIATSGTYQPSNYISGSGLSLVNQVYLTCARNSISCGNYTWTSVSWSGKFVVINDALAVFAPTLTVSSDPAGTYNWSVTFSGGGQSVVKYFTVTK